MYASLLISLLAAFIAMLGKQWLNRYLRHEGGSMIERSGDRQRKCDGLNKWPFRFFVESLPVMLQVALLLLACGLCKHMASINTTVAGVLITLTALGVLFYIGIVIVGTTSYACPFQTPASITLCRLWKKFGHHVTTALVPVVVTGRSLLATLHHVWEVILCQAMHMLLWLPLIGGHHHSQHVDLPVVQPNLQGHPSWLTTLHNMWEDIKCKILHAALYLPPSLPSPTIQEPTTLIKHQKANTHDILCVSWILWNITDPEALDIAIQLAGIVRWFENGLDVEPPYDQIVLTLKECFDSTGKMYPGLRDRAFFSACAILWIHICAQFMPQEFALKFTLPVIHYNDHGLDNDLQTLLRVYCRLDIYIIIGYWYHLSPGVTPAHLQWISNALLNLSWAKRCMPNVFDSINNYSLLGHQGTTPVNTLLNNLLVSCMSLGQPIDEELLKIQDKSYVTSFLSHTKLLTLLFDSDHSEQIVSQFSKAIISAIHTSHPQCKLLSYPLYQLTRMENHPIWLTKMAYEWCSVICENYSSLRDGKELLFLALEIGFRHLNLWISAELTHTEHHQKMVDIVFEDARDGEAIADLLLAWTSTHEVHKQYMALGMCARQLIHDHVIDFLSSSQRLQQLVICAIGFIGFQEFKQVEVGGFCKLLDCLHVSAKDIYYKECWTRLLLDTVQSSEGIQCLSYPYWELLVELVISYALFLRDITWSPHVMAPLEGSQEWDKLGCWIAVGWISLGQSESSGSTEDAKLQKEGLGQQMGQWSEEWQKNLEDMTLLLFHQQPGAIQKLEQWMEKWRKEYWMNHIPRSFQQICEKAYLRVAQQGVM